MTRHPRDPLAVTRAEVDRELVDADAARRHRRARRVCAPRSLVLIRPDGTLRTRMGAPITISEEPQP